jgi:hypothetical protein
MTEGVGEAQSGKKAMYALLTFFGLSGGYVAIVTVVDFAYQGKAKILLIAGGILLILASLFYVYHFSQKANNRRVAAFLAAVLMLAVADGGFLTWTITDDSGTPSSSPPVASSSPSATSPTPSTATSVPPGATVFAIDAPADNSAVGSGVFSVSGTTPPLGDDRLWLMDYASGLADRLVYYRTSPTPIAVNGTNWSTTDGPVGSPNDAPGTVYKIVIVRANDACNSAILAAGPNQQGDVVLEELPSGCGELGSVHVIRGH